MHVLQCTYAFEPKELAKCLFISDLLSMMSDYSIETMLILQYYLFPEMITMKNDYDRFSKDTYRVVYAIVNFAIECYQLYQFLCLAASTVSLYAIETILSISIEVLSHEYCVCMHFPVVRVWA